MRHIRHPGQPAASRTSAVADLPIALRFALRPGETVLESIAKGFAEAGCRGGVVRFDTGRCEPFQYVMPANSRDGAHAAWYSDVFAPVGPVSLKQCVAIVGERDGQPFIHCHGAWETTEGLRMGHMLGAECQLVSPGEASGIGFRHATFGATPDGETHFTLFEPMAIDASPTASPTALLVRIRPNEDVCEAIEAICRDHRITSAQIHGIGSLNEVRFADGRQLKSHATELLVRSGSVDEQDRELRARLDIAVVGIDGTIAEGEILRGENPVCVTFELVLVAQAVQR